MRNFILALTALLLLASCKSVSTGSVITVATSSSPQAAARALLKRKKLTYMRNPVQLVELHAVQQEFCRMQPAQTLAHQLVDTRIIMRGGFPAHATDEAERLHGGESGQIGR